VDANQSIGEVRLHGYMAVSGVDRSRCDFGHREFACEPHVPVRVVVGTARTSGVVTLEADVTVVSYLCRLRCVCKSRRGCGCRTAEVFIDERLVAWVDRLRRCWVSRPCTTASSSWSPA